MQVTIPAPRRFNRPTLLLCVALSLAACSAGSPPVADRAGTSAAVKVPGYLLPAERPDSVALVPPPPAPDSLEFKADQDNYQALSALAGKPRWRLAAADANLKFPEAANAFACATGFNVDETSTPHLYTLLQRTIIDAGQSTYAAKQKYNRQRPFEATGDPTCVPEDEPVLRGNASYPSGHASLGYVWGEVLAEVVPDRADAVRARAFEFGQSRVVCRVHWASDVDAGRIVGRAVLPILHRNAEFQADLDAAKREVTQARADAVPVRRDCKAESAALRATAPAI